MSDDCRNPCSCLSPKAKQKFFFAIFESLSREELSILFVFLTLKFICVDSVKSFMRIQPSRFSPFRGMFRGVSTDQGSCGSCRFCGSCRREPRRGFSGLIAPRGDPVRVSG